MHNSFKHNSNQSAEGEIFSSEMKANFSFTPLVSKYSPNIETSHLDGLEDRRYSNTMISQAGSEPILIEQVGAPVATGLRTDHQSDVGDRSGWTWSPGSCNFRLGYFFLITSRPFNLIYCKLTDEEYPFISKKLTNRKINIFPAKRDFYSSFIIVRKSDSSIVALWSYNLIFY